MLTDEQIKAAINEMCIYFGADEPYDHIRMAYEWLDAQEKTKQVMSQSVMFNSEFQRHAKCVWIGAGGLCAKTLSLSLLICIQKLKVSTLDLIFHLNSPCHELIA